MKKIIIAIAVFSMVCGFSGLASAGDNESAMSGSITLTDTAPRPGAQNIGVSINSFVTYTSAQSTGVPYDLCGIASASGKATNEEVLMFEVYGNQSPGQTDDNNVYQKALGATPTDIGAVAWEEPTSGNDWVIRGVGSPSTFTASGL